MIVLLLVDYSSGRWQPLVATQYGSSSSARLAVIPSDFNLTRPTLLVAGSFQTIGTPGLVVAHRSVPGFDGLHIVLQRHSIWAFVRRGGEAAVADPADVTVDDLRQTLDDAEGRLFAG
jgi:hypothetical protein